MHLHPAFIRYFKFRRRVDLLASFFTDAPQYILQLVDLFYKISLIIALFYATRALRIYIDKNQKK